MNEGDIKTESSMKKSTKKKKQEETGRGRSKKRKSVKKEPFGHIAKQLVPAAAIATAVPKSANVIPTRRRTPSPFAKAIVFASRMGLGVAGGRVLTRSLSEQAIDQDDRTKADLAASKAISKSHPGPSGTQEPLQHDDSPQISDHDYDDDEAGYASVEDLRPSTWLQRQQQLAASNASSTNDPNGKRPPMPLPDQDATDGSKKHAAVAKTVEDLYSKVHKDTLVKSETDKIASELTPPNEDSDDITSVSEMDDDLSSKLASVPRGLKGSSSSGKRKMQPHGVTNSNQLHTEEMSDSPSEGEVYKLPYDFAILSEKAGGSGFETIEEFEEDNLSTKSKNAPSPVDNKLSSPRDDLGTSIRAKQSSSPGSPSQTPRELGKEAALRKLEELGFDGMSKEFDIDYSKLDFTPRRKATNDNENDDDDDKIHAAVEKFTNESPQLDSMYFNNGVSQRQSKMRRMFEKENHDIESKSTEKKMIVNEEMLVASEDAFQHHAVEELRLGDLVADDNDSNTDGYEKIESAGGLKGLANSKGITKSVADSDYEMPVKGTMELGKYEREASSRKEAEISGQDKRMREMMKTTEHELRKQRDVQNTVLENQARMQEQMNGLYDSITTKLPLRDYDVGDTTDDYREKLRQQLQVQREMEKKQEQILTTIRSLESQMKNASKQHASLGDNRQHDVHKSELLELRKMILQEQKRYHEQQKRMEHQQQKILNSQQQQQQQVHSSPRRTTSTTQNTPRTGNQHRAEPHLQFMILESRLKAVEAERRALLDLNASMQEENDALKKISSHYDDTGSSEFIYKRQNQDLAETNKQLKSVVHRLNIELSRFQAKYRPPRKEEVEGLSMPEEETVPHWLVNTKYLSPLILAYDDRLKDKNELIRAYENQLASFKARILDVVKENQRLHLLNNEKNHDGSVIPVDDWNLLQEQARLVVEENSILMQEIDLKDKRIEELQSDYNAEVLRFSKQIRILEKEKSYAQRNSSDLQYEVESWKKKHQDALMEAKDKVSQHECELKIQDTKRNLTSEIESLKRENESSMLQLQATLREKQQLAVKLTDETAKNSTMQVELNLAMVNIRKLEKKILILQKQASNAKEKEQVATETLTEVLSVAEKNAQDRDDLAKLIHSQNEQQKMEYEVKKDNDIKFDLLRSNLKKYKKISKQKDAEIAQRMKEKDNEIINMKNNYEAEVENLKAIIRERQIMLEFAQSTERQFENEIDVMRRSLEADKESMKKSL
eukprot:gene19189-21111_t